MSPKMMYTTAFSPFLPVIMGRRGVDVWTACRESLGGMVAVRRGGWGQHGAPTAPLRPERAPAVAP